MDIPRERLAAHRALLTLIWSRAAVFAACGRSNESTVRLTIRAVAGFRTATTETVGWASDSPPIPPPALLAATPVAGDSLCRGHRARVSRSHGADDAMRERRTPLQSYCGAHARCIHASRERFMACQISDRADVPVSSERWLDITIRDWDGGVYSSEYFCTSTSAHAPECNACGLRTRRLAVSEEVTTHLTK